MRSVNATIPWHFRPLCREGLKRSALYQLQVHNGPNKVYRHLILMLLLVGTTGVVCLYAVKPASLLVSPRSQPHLRRTSKQQMHMAAIQHKKKSPSGHLKRLKRATVVVILIRQCRRRPSPLQSRLSSKSSLDFSRAEQANRSCQVESVRVGRALRSYRAATARVERTACLRRHLVRSRQRAVLYST